MSAQEHRPTGGRQLGPRGHGRRVPAILRLWLAYEWLWQRFHRTYSIPYTEGGLFHVQFWRYRGRPIELPDGTRVARGDLVAILHIRNRELAELTEESPNWQILRLMVLDLRALAAWAGTPAFPPGVRAIYGMTMISRAAPRLGFALRDRPRNIITWLDRWFLLGILVAYHPHGMKRLLEGRLRATPLREVWMSLSELERRYGASSSTR